MGKVTWSDQVVRRHPYFKEMTHQQVIGMISTIAFAALFSIAAFYNMQFSFAMIKSCFITVFAGAISYCLVSPPFNPPINSESQPTKKLSCSASRTIYPYSEPDSLLKKFKQWWTTKPS